MICNICIKEAKRLIQIREETEGSPTIAVFSRWICLKCLQDIMFPLWEENLARLIPAWKENIEKLIEVNKKPKKKEEIKDG